MPMSITDDYIRQQLRERGTACEGKPIGLGAVGDWCFDGSQARSVIERCYTTTTAALAGVLDAKVRPMVTVPTLILRGQDDCVTAACVIGWRRLPNVKFEEIPLSAHFPHLECPAAFRRCLYSFLENACDESKSTKAARAPSSSTTEYVNDSDQI